MSSILINGTEHEITRDQWNSPLIDGKPVDIFLADCSLDDIRYLAQHGLDVLKNDLEHFNDITERYEL